jgi:hypothetical protein
VFNGYVQPYRSKHPIPYLLSVFAYSCLKREYIGHFNIAKLELCAGSLNEQWV